MKTKKFLATFLALILALSCMSITAFAAETNQLTVNEPAKTSDTNIYLPYYGGCVDEAGLKSQFIQPADTIAAMNGQKITQMTFYVSYGEPVDAIFEVRLMETDTTDFTDALLDVTSATLVYTGTAAVDSSKKVVIPFTTPYIYQGGNLLVEFRVTTSSSTKTVQFSAKKDVGYNCGIRRAPSASTAYTYQDLPKVTFDYTVPDYDLDLEDSDTYPDSKTIDQKYTLTPSGDTVYTDTTKVKVEWTLPEIAATYASNKTWDPDTMSWVESKSVAEIGEKTATFTFTNYSSVAVGAKVSFAKAIGTDSNPYVSDVMTLDTLVAEDHSIKSTAANSGTITHKYTPTASDFNNVSADSGTYGTYTVSIVSAVKVTFDLQGHGDAIDAQYVGSGGKVTAPTAPTAIGYTFGGWYKEAECSNEWDFTTDTVTAATTLYAKWTQD